MSTWGSSGITGKRLEQQQPWMAREPHPYPIGKHGFRGVVYLERKRKFLAGVRKDGRRYSRGYFPTATEAARAYDELARKHHGEHAVLNFPESGERAASSASSVGGGRFTVVQPASRTSQRNVDTMTISKDKGGEYSVQCDESPDALGPFASWRDAKEAADAAGWRTFKGPDDEWANACPACVAAFAKSFKPRRTS